MRTALLLMSLLLAGAAARAQTPARSPEREVPAPAATADAAAMKAWVAAHIDDGKFAYVDRSRTAAYFMRIVSTDPTEPLTRIERRREFFSSQTSELGFAYRSTLNMLDVDCDRRRYRSLTNQQYTFSNLQGEMHNVDAQKPLWTYPRVGEAAEMEITVTCKRRKEGLAFAASRKPAPKGLLK